MSGVELSRQLYEAINSGAPESHFSELRRAGAHCEDSHFASAASAADDGVLGALWNVWPEMKVPQQAYEQIALEAKLQPAARAPLFRGRESDRSSRWCSRS